ncbi:MAG: universal stress protein [Myxococcales bacterium]|nr:universal stress protein [Myxococcales bacterium]
MSAPVVVAVDLGVLSDTVLRRADARARAAGAPLVVCHVMPTLDLVSPLFPQQHASRIIDQVALRRELHDVLADRVARITHRSSSEVAIELLEGPAAQGIVTTAETREAALIVVGAHGGSALLPAFLGSVAGNVIRQASSAVLIVRGADEGAGPVLAATDFSDPALPAVKAGVREARERGARLLLANVLDVPSVSQSFAAQLFGGGYLISQVALTEMRSGAEKLLEATLANLQVEGEVVVLEGSPGQQIVAEATRRHAQLVSVGTRGRSGLARLVLGSVAEHVVRLAPCDVLVSRLTG